MVSLGAASGPVGRERRKHGVRHIPQLGGRFSDFLASDLRDGGMIFECQGNRGAIYPDNIGNILLRDAMFWVHLCEQNSIYQGVSIPR